MTSFASANRHLRGIASPIVVDRRLSKPLYQQIYEAYRTSVVRRTLRAGQLVASTRELARHLGISRLPVLNAYAQLLAEGYFESRPGSGTFIAASLPALPPDGGYRSAGDRMSRPRRVAIRASAFPLYEGSPEPAGLGAFQIGQPALQDFPLEIWSRLVSRYSRRMRVSELQYGSPMGLDDLRVVIANYLRTARGVRCETEQIMIVSGSQQALDISARVLLDSGAPVWVEEPGYWLVRHVLKGADCCAIPIPVDAEGLNVACGARLCRKARAAFVTPSHQYPLGVTMSATRRFQLLEWAENSGSWIIEDDYDSEYRYDSMPITSLQGLDSNSRVIYIGSFSKVLFPSLRLGYIVIPRDLVERFCAVRRAVDLCPSHSNQEVLAHFIREGHFSRHLRKMRRTYEERRRVLVEAINKEFGSTCEIVGAEAGMHLTMIADDTVRDTKIAARAAERRLWLSPLSLSYTGDSPRPGFVLGFGNAPAPQIPAAVHLLKKLVTS